ncbi:hypothetical protein V6274_13945 [Pseudomonas aeruginosa]|uniref:hypothetical protein n=1 Tax=Pseudomonas aeruginosa TaxID=287 RepID=UPI000EAFD1C7|nr:hypothetical protein [Pseudomonas aeruginosa]
MVTIKDISSVFGRNIEDELVKRLLDRIPDHRVQKQSDGSQYVVAKASGLDLLFSEPNDSESRTSPKTRVLSAAFLFNEGMDKHQRYEGEIPFGFLFSDTRTKLLDKRMPDRTWVIGEGAVSVDHPNPDNDRWTTDEFQLFATYKADGTIRDFTLQLAKG